MFVGLGTLTQEMEKSEVEAKVKKCLRGIGPSAWRFLDGEKESVQKVFGMTDSVATTVERRKIHER